LKAKSWQCWKKLMKTYHIKILM